MTQAQMTEAEGVNDGAAALRLLNGGGASIDKMPVLGVVLEAFADNVHEQLAKTGAGFAEFELGESTNGNMDDLLEPVTEPPAEEPGSALYGLIKTSLGEARLLMRFDYRFIHEMTDYLFGGDGKETAELLERPATALEQSLILLFSAELIQGLQTAFATLGKIKFEIEDVMNGQDERLLELAGRATISTGFKLVTEQGGELVLAIPLSLLSPMRKDLAKMAVEDSPAPSPDWTKRIFGEIRQSDIELRTILGQCELSLHEISYFKPGQVVQIETGLNSLVRVECNNEPVFWCELGQESGNYSLRIKKFVDREQEFFNDILSG